MVRSMVASRSVLTPIRMSRPSMLAVWPFAASPVMRVRISPNATQLTVVRSRPHSFVQRQCHSSLLSLLACRATDWHRTVSVCSV
jgi:hypothetical protein